MPYTFVYGEKRSIINLEANLFTYLNNKNILGNELNNIACYSENNFAEVYYDSGEIAEQSMMSEKLLDREIAKKLLEKADASANSFNIFLAKLSNKNFSKSSNQELLELFNRYFELLSGVFSYYRFSRPEFTDPMKEKIVAEFKALGLGEKEIANILTPKLENQISLEKKSFSGSNKKRLIRSNPLNSRQEISMAFPQHIQLQ